LFQVKWWVYFKILSRKYCLWR